MNLSNTQPTETTLTSKGQVTIPADIREHLGVKPQDRIRFTVEQNGVVRISPAPSAVVATYGAVKPHKKPENFAALHEAFEKGVAANLKRHG